MLGNPLVLFPPFDSPSFFSLYPFKLFSHLLFTSSGKTKAQNSNLNCQKESGKNLGLWSALELHVSWVIVLPF